MTSTVTLLLTGDVMPGRGIDRILPHPGDPELREPHVRDAGFYVRAVEQRSGPLPPRPVPFAWPWGAALAAMDAVHPDARILNLETSVTRSRRFARGKTIHYRMHPDNLPMVLAARPDVCVLANNHVLDFGRGGLVDTVTALTRAGVAAPGAGYDAAQAARPATVPLGRGRRLLVFAAGSPTSGIPDDWAATSDRPGVRLLPELSAAGAEEILAEVAAVRRPGDVVVFSVHWGTNWGYQVPAEQVRFARTLVEHGVNLVHGHSSHHPRPIEVHHGRLILYGCGDLLNDYEGISGFERYRGDLRLLYVPTLDADTGELTGLRLLPLQSRRLRLQPAGSRDRGWLAAVLGASSEPFGTHVASHAEENVLTVSWARRPSPSR